MNKNDVYQDVTNRIIDALEAGLNGKFEFPWHGVTQLPENDLFLANMLRKKYTRAEVRRQVGIR